MQNLFFILKNIMSFIPRQMSDNTAKGY